MDARREHNVGPLAAISLNRRVVLYVIAKEETALDACQPNL